jgi:hypothetical protein
MLLEVPAQRSLSVFIKRAVGFERWTIIDEKVLDRVSGTKGQRKMY